MLGVEGGVLGVVDAVLEVVVGGVEDEDVVSPVEGGVSGVTGGVLVVEEAAPGVEGGAIGVEAGILVVAALISPHPDSPMTLNIVTHTKARLVRERRRRAVATRHSAPVPKRMSKEEGSILGTLPAYACGAIMTEPRGATGMVGRSWFIVDLSWSEIRKNFAMSCSTLVDHVGCKRVAEASSRWVRDC